MSIAVRRDEVTIRDVRFEADRLSVELSDGRLIATPLRWYPRLAAATPEQMAEWELLGGGIGIHWPQVDEDLSLEGMLAGRSAPGGVRLADDVR